MEELERINQRKRFNKWRDRAKVRLNPLIAKFFTITEDYYFLDRDQARRVARIIDGFYNPYFEFNHKLEPLADTDIIAKRILLELDVEDFCKFMKKNFAVSK